MNSMSLAKAAEAAKFIFLDTCVYEQVLCRNVHVSHDTAISLFCSCANVRPSGACRNRTISDCLK
jgi:hypothetical protein